MSKRELASVASEIIVCSCACQCTLYTFTVTQVIKSDAELHTIVRLTTCSHETALYKQVRP